jgi:hypothetical protein
VRILGAASVLASTLLALSASTVEAQTDPSKPMQYKLEPPRAFVLRLTLPLSGPVETVIYDVHGRAIRHLKSGWLAAGPHVVHWDGLRDQGSPCAGGVYFVTTRVGEARLTSRIVKVN